MAITVLERYCCHSTTSNFFCESKNKAGAWHGVVMGDDLVVEALFQYED